MKTMRLWTGMIAVLAVAWSSPLAAAPQPSQETTGDRPSIEKLVSQLGDDQYAVRRRAEEELLRLGPDAYDQLKLAEDSDDLEISERVRYVLQRLRVEWVRDNDSAEVRRALTRFEDLTEPEKNSRIFRLADLADAEGLGALCRIARFEPSPRVARRAALEIVERADDQFAKSLPTSPAVDVELGTSDREPAEWIRQARTDLVAGAKAAPWQSFADAEAKLLAEQSPDADFVSLYRLLRRQLALSEADGAEQVAAALRRIIDLDPQVGLREQRLAGLFLVLETKAGPRTRSLLSIHSVEDSSLYSFLRPAYWPALYTLFDDGEDSPARRRADALYFAMQWSLDHRQPAAAEALVVAYDEDLADERGLLYHLAAVRGVAGQQQLVVEAAERAFNMKESVEAPGRVGYLAAELGLVDWAIREYRRDIDESDRPSATTLEVATRLAMWLHDREDYRGAADVLDQFNKSISEDVKQRRQLMKELDGGRDGRGRELIDELRGRRDFYLACDHQARGEHDRQRELLLKAIKISKDDPDILIAMYRSEGANEEFKEETLARIQDLSVQQQALIDQYPEAPYVYNQWAWLISNTTGDYARAVEYSKRSLELSPDEPSYLDTLGRCYYAAGDLENAVKYQREAVSRAPHYQVMQRQLSQFERELAAKGK